MAHFLNRLGVFAVALALIALPLAAQDVDVTGNWEPSFQDPQGGGAVARHVALVQEGTTVTGEVETGPAQKLSSRPWGGARTADVGDIDQVDHDILRGLLRQGQKQRFSAPGEVPQGGVCRLAVHRGRPQRCAIG